MAWKCHLLFQGNSLLALSHLLTVYWLISSDDGILKNIEDRHHVLYNLYPLRSIRSESEMRSLQTDALHAYKAVIKAMVRTNKRSVITHKLSERKQEIALLTYKRMSLVREANLKDVDALRKARVLKDLNGLNKKVEALKNEDITRDRALLYLANSTPLKNLFLSHELNKRNINHFNDVASFLNNQREYDELIQRYNPGTKLSQEEIVKRTAERVGLNVPFQ